jgi:4-hydroxy-2-oxoheptanedioate aldolase
MIETRSAVKNLEAILDVEGVAGVYIGPSDLGLSYGLAPRFDRQEPEILAIYDRVIAECAKRKIFAAIHTGGADDAAKCIARGFRLVTLTNDVSLMAMAARGAVAQTRKESNGVA